MDTLDDLAARSAAAVRAEADALADTESALADVKSGIAVTTVVPLAERGGAGRWWLGVAAAAALVGIIAVGAVVMTREDPDTLSDAAAPPATTVAATVSTSLGSGAMSEPPTLTEAEAEVLYETTVGAELGQLGVEDELRPLAPIVAPDGDLILGDPVNHRWILVREGETLAVEYDENEFVWDAVLGVDGNLYSLVYNWSNKGLVNGRVGIRTPEFTDPDGTVLIVGDCCRRLVYDGSFENAGVPQVTDDAVVMMGDGQAPVVVLGEAEMVSAMYLDGTARTWSVPAIQLTLSAEMHALPSGELVILQRFANPETVTWAVRLLRLDGTVATELITLESVPDDNIGKLSVGADGISMLQRVDESTFRVLRFPLPTVVEIADPAETTVVVDGTTLVTEVATSVLEVEPTVSTSIVVGTDVPVTDVTTVESTVTVPENPTSIGGTVLYEASVGSGEGQLGLEDCQECDPLAPLAPMVAPDGSVIIADTFNRRWVTIRDGVESSVPYTSTDSLVYDAVLGSDGNVYWVEYAGDGTTLGFFSAPSTDLSAEIVIPWGDSATLLRCCQTIEFEGSGPPSEPIVTFDDGGGVVIRRSIGDPALSATMEDDGGSTVVATYVDGSTQTWTLGIAGLDPQLPTLHVVPGTDLLVAMQTAPLSQEARIIHFVNVLHPDGTIDTVNLPPGVTTAGTAGHWSITADGVTTMIFDPESQLFQVVRYPLPS